MKIIIIIVNLLFYKIYAEAKSLEQQTYSSSVTQKKNGELNSISYTKNDDNILKDNQYAASQIMVNPTYDTSLYNSLLPHDVVHQYVSQYGGPYPPAPYTPYSTAPAGYAIQTGYEGYLVPEIQSEETPYSSVLSFVRNLMPRTFLGLIVRIGAYLMQALSVFFFGGILTTAVCTLTPLCTITFAALPFLRLRNTAENISKTIGAELTSERVQRTAQLVKDAIDKFSKLQAQNENAEKRKLKKNNLKDDEMLEIQKEE